MTAVDRLADLVGVETPSGHHDGMRACFDLLRGWVGTPGTVVVEDGVPHLWCAAQRPQVLLLGHVDTVWPLGTLDRRPFAVADGRATGPGVFDMKAGLVIAVEALRLTSDASHVSLLVTSDEEVGSTTSRALIERVAADHDAVLLLEPSLDGALKTARKGAGIYRLEVTGRAAHAGLEPETGVNALSELASLVMRMERLAAPDRQTTVTPTVARAGSATNAVAAHATLNVDVRAWESTELTRVDTAIRALTPSLPAAGLTVHGGINRHPMEPASSRSLLALARDVAASLGHGEVGEASVGGASDGNFTAAIGVPTLDGLGAVGDGAHAEHEWVDVASLDSRARLVAGMLDALRR